jgi:hypothetical protein
MNTTYIIEPNISKIFGNNQYRNKLIQIKLYTTNITKQSFRSMLFKNLTNITKLSTQSWHMLL